MKKHEYWQKQLNCFIDNELGPADHHALEEHLATCEDCSAQSDYLKSMKKRLRAHRDVVQMPETVKSRIHAKFRRTSNKRVWHPAFSLAAVILIFGVLVFTPVSGFFNTILLDAMPGREVVQSNLRGTIVCPDCRVALEIGVDSGALCCDGHVPGILDTEGNLWRVARDKKGTEFRNHFDELYGKQVVLSGDLIFSAHLIRLNKVETLNETLIGEWLIDLNQSESVHVNYSNPGQLLARVF